MSCDPVTEREFLFSCNVSCLSLGKETSLLPLIRQPMELYYVSHRLQHFRNRTTRSSIQESSPQPAASLPPVVVLAGVYEGSEGSKALLNTAKVGFGTKRSKYHQYIRHSSQILSGYRTIESLPIVPHYKTADGGVRAPGGK